LKNQLLQSKRLLEKILSRHQWIAIGTAPSDQQSLFEEQSALEKLKQQAGFFMQTAIKEDTKAILHKLDNLQQ